MRAPTALIFISLFAAACNQASPDVFQGYVEGDFVELASPHVGQLQRLQVRKGERVAAGQPVFVLEQEGERAAQREAGERIKAAEARLRNLRAARRVPELDALRAQRVQARAARDLSASQLAQQEKLYADRYVSQSRVDEARTAHERDAARVAEIEAQLANALQPLGREAELQAAQADIAAARAAEAQAALRLTQKTVSAPAAGVVHDTFFLEGEWVPAGRPVASLLPDGRVKARFYVPETVAGALAPGRAAEIRCDGCGAPIAATVSYVSPQAEYTPPVLYSREARTKLVFLVEARPAPEAAARLRPGQPIDVRLIAP